MGRPFDRRHVRAFPWPFRIAAVLCAALTLGSCTFAQPGTPAVPPPLRVAPDRDPLLAAVDAYMDAAVRNDHFSGSILIARNGSPLVSEAYGMANYELSVPNTSATVYHIASLTKQFTAMAIMQLQEQGRLAISDVICDYLDDCPDAWRPITIRQLLTHTSGVRNYSNLPDWDEELRFRNFTRPELVALFRNLPLEFTPGEKFKYTNAGYYLLGMIIERAAARPYGEVLRAGIFEPLGMNHTRYDESRALIANRAAGYYSLGTSFINAPYLNPTVGFAAGGIVSTTEDLLRWDQALYSGRLVSRQSLDEMFTPHLNGYGYGWQVGQALGRRKTDHSGSLNGFSTYILRFPEDRVTVIVLSNSDRASGSRTALNLARIAFGDPYELPRLSLRSSLYDTVARSGVETATQQIRALRQSTPGIPTDLTLVELGYDLLEGHLLAEATAIFELNLESYPRSAWTYDGLAMVASALGNTRQAIHYFEQSLAIDPDNDYAIAGLARLRRAGTVPLR